MSERFYLPDSLGLGPFSITGPEAHHMAQVLRLKPGSEVTLFNGNGHEYLAHLDVVHKNHVDVTIVSDQAISRERALALTIACPLPKGDRAAFLIEKLTELGVSQYIPLKTQRSVVHPGEGKMDKLHRYVIEASKQCGRNVLMTIEPMMEWSELAVDNTIPADKIIADGSGKLPLAACPAEQTGRRIVALGPEGGWTSDDLELALQHHWQVASLGPAILRIETAAIAAAVVSLQG